MDAIDDEQKLAVLEGLPPPTCILHKEFRCSEQEAGDLNRFPVTLELLLQFTVLDEIMEDFALRSCNY